MSKNLHELIRFILDLHKKKSFKEAIIAIEKFEKNNFSNPIILNLKGLSFFFSK